MPRNLRSDLFSFLRYLAGRGPRHLYWDPDGARADGTPATVLELEDTIPRPPFRLRSPRRLKITSKHERLDGRRFGAAGDVNEVGAEGHGRTVTCISAAGEPLAAIAYHLDTDKEAPLLVTAIAVIDVGTPAEQEFSRAMAAVLLCYLARAGVERGLPARLGFAPGRDGEAVATHLGFKATAAPSAYRDAGTRYQEWTPPYPIKTD